MIRHIVIKNFRCLRDLTIRLSPLTVLVGANGAGKTSILDALDPARRFGIESVWQRDPTQMILIQRAVTNAGGFTTSYQLGRSPSELVQGDEAYQYQLLRLELPKLRHDNQVEEERQLAQDGRNLTNVIASLTRHDQNQLAEQLCKLVPLYQDVDVRPVQGKKGSHGLFFQDRWRDSLWYHTWEVSDGTLLLLAFLTLGFQGQPPDLLAIEEPERGLHPYLLRQVVAMLRALSTGAIGTRPVQVVVATHSAELLDHLEPDEVRFLRRDPADGSVLVEEAPTGDPGWAGKLEEYQDSLGSAWLSGSLGGVTGAA